MGTRPDVAGALTGALCAVVITALASTAAAMPYDIVYVRQPRFGDTVNTTWTGSRS